MAVGHHRFGNGISEDPRSPKTNDNPLCVDKMVVGLHKVGIYLINKIFLRGTPEISVMTECTVVAPTHFNHIIVTEKLAALQAKE